MDWLDLLAVQGTLKSLLQHHSSKASILRHSAFFTVQLSHPYMTTGKTIALTRRTFAGKVISLLFNMLSRLVIAFLLRSKCHLISRLWCLKYLYICILGTCTSEVKKGEEQGSVQGQRSHHPSVAVSEEGQTFCARVSVCGKGSFHHL